MHSILCRCFHEPLFTTNPLIVQLHRELTLILEMEKSTEFLKDLPSWCQKILDYAKREAAQRPAVNSLLRLYNSEDQEQLPSDGE